MPVSRNKKKKKKKKKKQNPVYGKKTVQKQNKERLMQKLQGTKFENAKVQMNRFKHSVSELILDYGAPLLDECKSNEDFGKHVGFLVLCWNIANVPDEVERGKQIEEIVDNMLEPTRQKLGKEFEQVRTQFIDDMDLWVQRKILLYDEYKYMVVNYDLTFPDGEPYLTVASTKANV